MRHEEEEYLAEDGDYVPVDRWGKDHWQTFAYLEARAVDHKGVIRNAHMRTNARLDRHFVGIESGLVQDGAQYPTRLRDAVLEKHDDWSCLEDMVAAGLLRAWSWTARHGEVFGDRDARIEFTDVGLALVAQLRQHKARGGTFSNFTPTTAEVQP